MYTAKPVLSGHSKIDNTKIFMTNCGERSGSVLETEGPRVRASPASLRCGLEQDTLILAKYWFNPGRPVP